MTTPEKAFQIAVAVIFGIAVILAIYEHCKINYK